MSRTVERLAWLLTAIFLTATLFLTLRPAAALPERPLIEDGFYSLAVSRNIALGNGLTVDGTHATNGFQPLFTVLGALAYLPNGGDRFASLRLVLLMSWLLSVATALVVGDLATALVLPARRPTARALATLGWVGCAYTYFQHFNGLETGLTLLLYAVVARAWLRGAAESTAGALRLGVLLGLLVLARIDGALLVAGLCIALATDHAVPARIRIARSAGVGALALLVSSPWWIYNRVVFDSFMPTSGRAQQIWGVFPERFVAMGKATLMALAPMTALPGSAPPLEKPPVVLLRVVLIAALLVGISRAAARGEFVPDDVVRMRLGRLAEAGGIFLLGLYGYYTGGGHASWHYPRYLAPLAIPAVVGLAAWLAGRPARGQLAAVALIPALLGVVLSDLYGRGAWAHSPFWSAEVSLVRSHVPASDRVASWQSGTLGYFRTGVLNLDGKVNAEALRRRGDMGAYLREQGINWLVDWPSNVKAGLDLPGEPKDAGWVEVESKPPFTLYRRVALETENRPPK